MNAASNNYTSSSDESGEYESNDESDTNDDQNVDKNVRNTNEKSHTPPKKSNKETLVLLSNEKNRSTLIV